jgi:hypothetical protein
MPQATFVKTSAAVGRVCQFGGLALPNGQGVQGYLNLNDWTSWFLQDFHMDVIQALSLGALAWRAESAFLASDFPAGSIRLAMEYREASQTLGAAVARLAMAGEQYLTFDNLTGIPARFAAETNRQAVMYGPAVPRWTVELEFTTRQQWFQDLSATIVSPVTLNSGTLTNFNVTYAGSIFAKPVWTLTIPVGNAAPIAAFELQNVMSGEDLVIVFPGNLAASTAWTITIDSSAMTVVDGAGRSYDVAGNAFPCLHGPAGQVQQIRGTLTPASGTATSCTIGATYQARWLI